jgi:Xaa-Pro aminopeptidase
MTILKVTVDDEQADELKKLLNNISFIRSVEQEQINEPDVTYTKVKKILDAAKGKELFKDIKDPLEWQKNIRKEWERDF